MSQTVRAKFTCTHKSSATGIAQVSMMPVYSGSEENKAFFDATPSGSVSMGILRPEAAEFFEVGKSYYLDFTPAGE